MKTILVLMAAALMTPLAYGGVIITFDQPHLSGAAGDTLLFTGTITNDSSTDAVFLNGDDFNLELAQGSYTINDHFGDLPLSLARLGDTGSVPLFDVVLANPVVDLPGLYRGTWTLVGGGDDGAQLIVGHADFTVLVTPEPGSWGLLAAGLVVGALKWRGRKIAAARR